MNEMFLGLLFAQFMIQLFAYKQIKKILDKLINYPVKKHIKQESFLSFIKYEFVILNILISIAVLMFTSAGLIAGVTNLFASLLLGLVIAKDKYRYK